MPGANNANLLARRTLLDALDALVDYRAAVIVVGAQAIYLRTGESSINTGPLTVDADLALDPARLVTAPPLEATLRQAGFAPSSDPSKLGTWTSQRNAVDMDLLVPEAVGGRRGRGAHLEGHGDKVGRQVRGLEAALVDHGPMVVAALEPGDARQIEVNIAGPTALLVAKLYKLWERRDSPTRQDNKDALDVYRLLAASPVAVLATGFTLLRQTAITSAVTTTATTYLEDLFGAADSLGSRMAGAAATPLDDPDTIAASCAALAQDTLAAAHQP